MENHEFKITLLVKVNAPSSQDAFDMLMDTFGVGEECGITIEDVKVAPLGPPRK